MSKHIGPVCRLCRREGIKLMLKGLRCETSKCPMERQWRNSPPGAHSWRRGRNSDYAVRLREKQKVKRYYGVFERQFMTYFRRAERTHGNTGEILLTLLERRLDNVVHKIGLAPSRRAARQAIVHGHIHVNGRKVDRPSRLISKDDRVVVKPAEKSRKFIKSLLDSGGVPQIQSWLELDANKLEARVIALPTREDVQIPVEEQLIVEMCSR